MPENKPLLNALAQLLGCEEGAISERLNHPMVAQRVNEFLKGKMLRTNYLDNNGLNKDIKGSDCQIGLKSSREQHAYEGFLGITVEVNIPAFETITFYIGPLLLSPTNSVAISADALPC
jgi:hypothetical protein